MVERVRPSDLIVAFLCGIVLIGNGHPRLLMCALDREAVLSFDDLLSRVMLWSRT